jgi:hypothetical protein
MTVADAARWSDSYLPYVECFLVFQGDSVAKLGTVFRLNFCELFKIIECITQEINKINYMYSFPLILIATCCVMEKPI